MKDQQELFVVERSNGEWVDAYGNGGFSCFTSRAEAQDTLDSEDDPAESNIVRFVRIAWTL